MAFPAPYTLESWSEDSRMAKLISGDAASAMCSNFWLGGCLNIYKYIDLTLLPYNLKFIQPNIYYSNYHISKYIHLNTKN